MPGRGACMARGAYMAAVCVWWGCAWGGVHGWGHACPGEGGVCMPDTMRYGRSMSGWYTSYWNAFLSFPAIQRNFRSDTE